jgi:hypothetical protein
MGLIKNRVGLADRRGFFYPFHGMMNTPQLAPLSSFVKKGESGACCAILGGCNL